MIRLPEEIVHMIKKIEDAGFEAYAVGGCVRDSVLGRIPEDWDLTSNAPREVLEALFPDAAIVNRKLGVMRITEGELTADIAACRIDGEYKDYRRPETVIFTDDIGEDLRRRDFTMNAVAVSPGSGITDPWRGLADIEKKLIRGIGDPRVRIEEDALRILRAVRFAAQLDFEIEQDTLEAMKEKAKLLEHISIERIREEFVKTVAARSCGKGLRLFLETGAMPYILGEACDRDASEAERERFCLLTEKIDRTDPESSLRLALIYQCFEEGHAYDAIERLGYSNEMKKLLQSAVSLQTGLDAICDKTELKGFINRTGWTLYNYLTALAEQRRLVYETGGEALRRRALLLEEVKRGVEPIFLADLAVDGNDLKSAGIPGGAEIGRTLNFLLDAVHADPEKNRKGQLLKMASERIQFWTR